MPVIEKLVRFARKPLPGQKAAINATFYSIFHSVYAGNIDEYCCAIPEKPIVFGDKSGTAMIRKSAP